ncbi:hypothetical protein KUCAC02_012796, partial [Chaenocephalus aceratus]
MMAKTDNSEDINVRRDCVLSYLSIDLNEDLDTLVKEYVAAEDLRQSVKPKPDVKRTSNAVRPRQTSQGRPWESTPFELRVMILMVLVDALQMSVWSWKGSKFSTTSR